MTWLPLLVVAGLAAAIWWLKNSGRIPAQAARAHLENGALLVDVRSRGEYSAGQLPGAVNIPLNEIETALPRRVPDKNQPVLLHCASGMRSGVAQRKLEGMGYKNVFNLGSYGRARKIAGVACGH